MKSEIPKEYIENIVKATSQFVYKNGCIKEILEKGHITEEDNKKVIEYMENHLAYLYTVLLEESNIQKFDLIVKTMNKFYVDNHSTINIDDDGFDKFYDSLFPKSDNINIK